MAGERGFVLSHQKAVLAVDLRGKVKGHVELTIIPSSEELRTVYLNCRQCTVSKVSTTTHSSLSFSHLDPLAATSNNPTFTATDEKDVRSAYPELKRKLFVAETEADKGELAIGLPASLVKKVENTVEGQQTQASTEFEPIVITVQYDLVNPRDGLHFVGSDGDTAEIPHAYTSSSGANSARCWMPCVDTLWDRCTWEIELIVPRSIKVAADDGLEDIQVVEELPILAIASGELVEQVSHPHNSSQVIFHYAQSAPTSAHHIGFAVGPFHILDLSPPPVDDAPVVEDGQAKLHAFCLPGFEAELAHSVSFIRQALDFYVTEFGSYPYSSYKLVFIDDTDRTSGVSTIHNMATMTTFPAELLHSPAVIEQGLETRQILPHALACQWVGINIIQKTWSDTWLVNGLAFRLSSLFLRKLLGLNEYKFRLKKDMIRCCSADMNMPPICEPGIDHPPEIDVMSFINLKAPLVLHIMDQRLLKTGTSHGLSRVLPKVFLSAISGELRDAAISTAQFLRICKKVSGATDLKAFADQWIYASGCPAFTVKATFNRKKMAVEMTISQESPAWLYSCDKKTHWEDVAYVRPVEHFEGQMTIRVHEADGTPYEHVLDIRDPSKRYEVPFNTKYKRIRRQTKRYQARAAALAAAAADDAEVQEETSLIDMSYGLNIWEEEEERIKWRVHDWTDEDDEKMAHATYEWIRIDADFEWICTINFEQPDFMWVSQLTRDRDVVAQLEAVHALARLPTPVVASILARTVLTTNYFLRIRTEAVLALVSMAVPSIDYLGLFYLLKLYQTRFCFPPPEETLDPFQIHCVPKPNDFSDMPEYFLQLTLITALSHVRDWKGQAMPHLLRFLIGLLTYNDNSINRFSDSAYICTIFHALSNSFVRVHSDAENELFSAASDFGMLDDPMLGSAVDEVQRYMSMDRLVPSYRNAVSVAGLEWNLRMMLAGHIPVDLQLFFAYTREGNFAPVRMTAFEGLLLLRPLAVPALVQYFFSVLRYDQSLVVRQGLAEAIVRSMPLVLTIEGIGQPQAENIFVEEDPDFIKEDPKPLHFDVETAVNSLRRDLGGKNTSMRSQLVTCLSDSGLDFTVRWSLFKVCEILLKPKDEILPRIKLKVSMSAPAPVEPPPVEQAVGGTLPRLRLFNGPRPVSEPDPIPVPEPSAVVQLPEPSSLVLKLNNRPNLETASPPKRTKPPKAPKALKSQASGMSLDDVKACQNCLQKLSAHKASEMFRYPVDPIKDFAPNYWDIIKKPMDLNTITNKLNTGLYKNRDQFRKDIKLVVDNAILYNGAGSLIAKSAEQMNKMFDKQWSRINATLNAVEGKRAQIAKITLRPPAPQQPTYSEENATVPQSRLPMTFKLKAPSLASSSASQSAIDPPARSSPAPTFPRPTLKLSLGPSRAVQSAEDVVKPQKRVKILHSPDDADDMPEPPYTNGRGQTATISEIPPVSTDAVLPAIGAFNNPSPAIGAMNGSERKPAPKLRFSLSKPKPHIPLPSPNTSPAIAPVSNVATAPDLEPAAPATNGHPMPEIAQPASAPREDVAEASPAPLLASQSTPLPPGSAADPREATKSVEPVRISEPSAAPTPLITATQTSATEAPPIPASAQPPVHRPTPKIRFKTNSAPHGNGHTNGSASPAPSSAPEADLNQKKARSIIKDLLRMDESFFFRRPVDPVADGCPSYYDEIKQPMDLGTMLRNLDAGRYNTFAALNHDFQLIVSNCHHFNPPATLPVQYADILADTWKAEWSKAPKFGSSEKRLLQSTLKSLISADIAKTGGIFQSAVDPIALGIPQYFDIIPRENARDLSLIKSKLEGDKYIGLDPFDEDFRLMIQNALTFNPPGTAVHEATLDYEAAFDKAIKSLRMQISTPKGQKRGNSTSENGPNGKKARLY